MAESNNLLPLPSVVISAYRRQEAVDFHSNTADYLRNTELHEDKSGLVYCKIGGLYFISSSLEFLETKIDILPEPAMADGFMLTSAGETIVLTAGSTEIEAPTVGIKIISGFYAAKEQEH